MFISLLQTSSLPGNTVTQAWLEKIRKQRQVSHGMDGGGMEEGGNRGKETELVEGAEGGR